jgi:ferredoxin-NADP reductase
VAAILGAAGWYYVSAGSEDASLNDTKFTPFSIISREQLSSTAFILEIRCPEDVQARNAAKIQAAWNHGLWSVEMKQPQLQIARNYTPLPPLDGGEVSDGRLRFLVRKMDGGEMSNYLSRLQVGDQVWLRGPRYGFDVATRMRDATNVVFLAGGTGIAPALQITHKLLPDSSTVGEAQRSVRILWANRNDEDSVARDELGNRKARTWTGQATPRNTSSFSRQLVELKRRHGDSFHVDYFVDKERFITSKDINTAMGKPTKSPVFAVADKSCCWHSAERLAGVSEEEDALNAPEGAGKSSCTCRSHKMPPEPVGRNLMCVSGPDGFIDAYAGSKRWFGGREIQGPVLGLLGALKRMDPRMDDWLVLKL